MTSTQLHAIGGISEAPLLNKYRFSLEWADAALMDELIGRMRAESRQTMNLRTGVNPKLLVCRHQGDPVGWAGLDVETNPEYPELFSLYLYPEFRRYTIGLLLETARWRYLASLGIDKAYGRMELATNFRLLRYRLSTGLFERKERGDFPEPWADRCHGCELFGNECTQQTYIAIDVKRALASGESRIGPIDVDDLPRDFVIRADTMRSKPRKVADEDQKQRYRPYWL
ncbi:MAG: hypothetical protein AAF721_03775 [Myxococcota bacterium]